MLRDKAELATAGFNAHGSPLPSARMTLDEISQENAPSRWLEEASAQPKPAQQLGTLGGGNHFLEVLCISNPCHSQLFTVLMTCTGVAAADRRAAFSCWQ